jgi:hypothetical protein
MTPLVLAQSGAVFSADSHFTWPIVVALIALAGAAAQHQWRMGQAEKELDGLKKENTVIRGEVSALSLQVNSQQVILGEIRTMLTEIRADLRADSRRKEAS